MLCKGVKMFKKIKKMKNIRLIIADAILLAAMLIVFGVTYDINAHIGLYLLSVELPVVAVMLVRSDKK